MKQTSVTFHTTNETLQRMTAAAEEVCRGNIMDYDGRTVLVEGGGYRSMWPETSPMAGDMYAKRNMEIALTNQTIFLDYQRPDGRLPGMLHVNTTADVENQPDDIPVEPTGVAVNYGWLQGCCYPQHALNLYYYADLDKAYLERLYDAFSRYDEYLWRWRDSDGDGCLEVWCEWDTGEDNAARMRGMYHAWGSERPPEPGHGFAPMESMDVMAYSYVTRDVLAQISALLQNGRETEWREKAQQVAQKVRDYLWIEEKDACYDRDQNNAFIDILVHNNLRLMYYGVFSQEMADRFVKRHLKNPEEFWTNMPLPSVAANDPAFSGVQGNSWAGHPQGLTYQRSVLALERYGYVAELTHLFRKLSAAIGPACCFSQAYDTHTMEPCGTGDRDYGPTTLAFLELLARTHGVSVCAKEMIWGAAEEEEDWSYTQEWGDETYTLEKKGGEARALCDGRLLFTFPAGFRVVTDRNCKPLFAARIEETPKEFCWNGRELGTLSANETISLS